jgi:tripartite-type tricarboxylate transporter receptor subunit TctC
MKKRMFAMVLALAMGLSLLSGCGSQSQQKPPADDTQTTEPAATEVDFPTKEITLVVPFAAGGSSDLVARLFAETAKKYCDQPFVIVDQGGGGGVPATTEYLAKDPDGYTMIYAASAPTCTQPILSDVTYDIETDIDYLCQVNMDPLVVVAGADCPANNMDEFVEWVSGNNLTWGASNGGVHYFAALTMLMDLGIQSNYVPTEGGADSVAKLLGGHVDYVFIHPSEVLSSYNSGEVKVIGTMTEERVELLPDVPTLKEQGYDYVYAVLKGFIAPTGMDAGVREKLLGICQSVLEDEEFITKCKDIGAYVEFKPGEEYKAKNMEDFKTFSETLAAANG